MFRAYTMRLKVTKRQDILLTDTLEHLCVLYNSALEHRKLSWEQEQKSVQYNDQQAALVEFRRRSPEVKMYPSVMQRDPLRRVDLAFKDFFRRLKSGEKPGYPRFKSKTQYHSFTVAEAFRFEGNVVYLPKWGGFRFKTKHKMKGTPKVLRINRVGRHWILKASCDIGPAPEKLVVRNAVGVDLGLTTLATLSDGTQIVNPRWTKQEENRLAEANRDLSRRTKGSNNRKKSKERLRRIHQRIAGLRRSYLHDVSRILVDKYDLIAHENLKISEMAKSRFGKSIMDAAWGELLFQIKYKAESAGKWFVPVEPRGTTQTCSGCGELVPKRIWNRTHNCPKCGLSLGRDHNAALNILRLGESLVSKQNQILETVSA